MKTKTEIIKKATNIARVLIKDLSDDDIIYLGNDYSYSINKLKEFGILSLEDNPYILNFNNKKYLIGTFGCSNEDGYLYWICEDCVSRILFNWSISTGLGYQSSKGYIHKLTGKVVIEEKNNIIKDFHDEDRYDFDF